jgi:hypothetical protein
MTFQYGTTASSDARRDLLTDYVATATSQHVSAAVINAGGTGYVVGDVLTISHAGAYGDCKLVVTTESGGVITGVRIAAGGAFSIRVASVAINAAGTGYAVGDIVNLTTGTFTEFCKVKIDTEAAGVPATISVYETGGAYTVAPTASAGATNSTIGTGTGTGLTIDTTVTALLGTSAIAATGGTGSSATFDLTLTATGWSAINPSQNQNNYSYNSITDEKEVILKGTVAGGNEPYVGIRTYTEIDGIGTNYGWVIAGMDSYNSGLAFASQSNIGPQVTPTNSGVYHLVFDNAQDYWFSIDGRRLIAVVKAVGGAVTSYTSSYAGLLDPYGTTTEQPYQMYLAATTGTHNRAPDDGSNYVTGLTEVFSDATNNTPAYFRRADGAWTIVQNSAANSAKNVNVITPLGAPALVTGATDEDDIVRDGQLIYHLDGNTISREGGGTSTTIVMPSITTNLMGLIPTTLVSSPNGSGDNDAFTMIQGDLAGVYWTPATDSSGNSITAEDTVNEGSNYYIVFPNVHRRERYSFFVLKQS